MARRIVKNSAKKFYDQLKKFILEEMNGKLTFDNKSAKFEVQTDYGKMTIALPEEQNSVYSMFCKFEEPKRAYAEMPWVNKFSGKYNFHMSPVKIATVIGCAKIHLETTKKKKESVKKYLHKLN